MSDRVRRKVGGWHLSVGVRLMGYYVNVAFYPLGAWRRLMLVAAGENSMTPGWHLMAGPLHAHGYYLGPKLFELDADIAHDPFWGTAIQAPPRYRVLLGSKHARNNTPNESFGTSGEQS